MFDWIRDFIIHYGYFAIFIGTFLDSEAAVLVLGGIAVRLGYLELHNVIIVSYLGVFGGDQLYYFLGFWKGEAILSKFPWLKWKIHNFQAKIGSQKILKILVFRFLLSLRIPAPFFLGFSNVPYSKFGWVDALLLAPWTVGLCLAGYILGRLVKKYLVQITHYQFLILGGIIGIWILLLVVTKIYHRRDK